MLVEVVIAGIARDLAAVDFRDLVSRSRFMKSRSCEVMNSAPVCDFRKRSSQMIDSISRWLVGSSISRMSGLPSSTRAMATRIFHPPESDPTSPSMRSSSKPRPCRTSRACPSSAYPPRCSYSSCTTPKRERILPWRRLDPDRPWHAGASPARGEDLRGVRYRQWLRRAPSGRSSPPHPAGNNRR